MKIVTLIENTSKNESLFAEHGLCIYIETNKHHLLMDTGSSDAFIFNANQLNIHLNTIDTVVVSHGHYDHTGGLLAFGKINLKAKIYMQANCDQDYYHGSKYIGIDKEIMKLSQLCLLEDDFMMDDELSIFTHINGRRYFPSSNLELSVSKEGVHVQDDFSHEQCLVVSCEGKKVLLSGCAHNGILNVLDRFKEIYHQFPDVVISGFHMKKKTAYTKEEINHIQQTAMHLKQMPTLFYTGHCTGDTAFEIMSDILGEQLKPLYSGCEILINKKFTTPYCNSNSKML